MKKREKTPRELGEEKHPSPCWSCEQLSIVSRNTDEPHLEYYCSALRGWLNLDRLPRSSCSGWHCIEE